MPVPFLSCLVLILLTTAFSTVPRRLFQHPANLLAGLEASRERMGAER